MGTASGLMPLRIFISYRREDAAGDAGRLADHVQRRFGAARVFLDIETIEPGTDFVKVLRESLQETAVLLVVIGPRWTSLCAADGSRRLDDPADFVRMEVEAALGRDIPLSSRYDAGSRCSGRAQCI
jgi:TIR domain